MRIYFFFPSLPHSSQHILETISESFGITQDEDTTCNRSLKRNAARLSRFEGNTIVLFACSTSSNATRLAAPHCGRCFRL